MPKTCVGKLGVIKAGICIQAEGMFVGGTTKGMSVWPLGCFVANCGVVLPSKNHPIVGGGLLGIG